MTLPRKHRRSIEVDGTRYHYCIRFSRSERAVIQHANGEGACLFVFPHTTMKPKQIADAIRFGIDRGWNPGQPGSNVWVAFDLSSAGETMLEFIPDNDFRVVTYNTSGVIPESIEPDQFSDTRKWHQRSISIHDERDCTDERSTG